LNATIASALVVGAINIVILLALSALALTRFQLANLTRVDLPLFNGRPADPSILGVIFGVILTAYFGHLSVGNCARVVLRRDPSGRSLIWGNIAAQATAILLYCTYVLAVAGAVPAAQLTAQTGTSLEPLAAELGQGVRVLGFAFVVLGIGMASIHFSLGLFNLVRERLPAIPDRHMVISPTRGSELMKNGREPQPGVSLRDALLIGRGRFLIEIGPVALIFSVAEWALFTHTLGFTAILGFIGVIVVSLLAGIFPILLIVASRRKGEYTPGTVYRLLGNPVLLTGLYLLFLASLLAHGFIIWQDRFERGLALTTALVVVALTVGMIRGGLLSPRVVVELREQQGQPRAGVLAVTAGGKASHVRVCLEYPEGEQVQEVVGGQAAVLPSLKSISMKLPSLKHADLKVWMHRVTPGGDSEPLQARVAVQCGDLPNPAPIRIAKGIAVLPLKGEDCNLSIQLDGGAKISETHEEVRWPIDSFHADS
jgi:hypothetical protein